jgi:hypothetical protein
MRVSGKYEKSKNFTRVYSNNTVYEIARNSGEWSALKVGECDRQGNKLTLEQFNEWENACEKVGSFDLKEV